MKHFKPCNQCGSGTYSRFNEYDYSASDESREKHSRRIR
jgi:hypothetical protein